MASVYKLRKPVGEASVLQAVNTAGVLNDRKNCSFQCAIHKNVTMTY